MKTTAQAIKDFCEVEGYPTPSDALRETFDAGMPNAICMNDGCDFTELMEDDQDAGYCYNCETNTVKSIQILMGFI